MEALEWIVEGVRGLAEYVLGWLVVVALVLAGVGLGVGVYEHDWLLAGLGVGFFVVACVLAWLDDMEV